MIIPANLLWNRTSGCRYIPEVVGSSIDWNTDNQVRIFYLCILGFHYTIVQWIWVEVNLSCTDAYAVLEWANDMNLINYGQGRIFIFFNRRGGKISGWVQVICNMLFLMFWKGHEMANQSAPGGWSKILVGLNTVWRGLRKIWGGFNPPPPRELSHMKCHTRLGLAFFSDEGYNTLRPTGASLVRLYHCMYKYNNKTKIVFASSYHFSSVHPRMIHRRNYLDTFVPHKGFSSMVSLPLLTENIDCKVELFTLLSMLKVRVNFSDLFLAALFVGKTFPKKPFREIFRE